MSSPSGTATIGLQVVLNDAASAGLTALGLGFLGLSTNIARLNSAFTTTNSGMAALGLTAIAAGALFGIFAGAIAYSIEQGQGLQDALVQVENSVQGTDSHMQEMTQTIITLGNQSVFSSQELADGFAAMGKNGQDAADIIDYTGQQMVILAEATNSDTVPAANLLSSTMQMYNANANQSADYTKALTFAFYNGQGSISGLQAAMNASVPTAKLLGVNIDQLAVWLAVLGQNGIKGEQAGVDLNYIMQGLVNPTQAATIQLANLGLVTVNQVTPAMEALTAKMETQGGVAAKEAAGYNGTIASLQAIYTWAQKLGDIPFNETMYQWALQTGLLTNNMYNAQGQFVGINQVLGDINTKLKTMSTAEKMVTLDQLFNVQGGKGAEILLSNFQQTETQWQNLTPLLAQTNPLKDAERVVGTLTGQVKALGTSIQDAAGTIGMQMFPILTKGVSLVNGLVGDFAKAATPVHQFAAVFLLAGAAISGFALVVAAVVAAAVMIGPALITVAAIMGGLLGQTAVVTAAFLLIQTHAKQIQQALQPLGPVFQMIGTALNNLATTAKSAFGPAFQQIATTVRSQLLPALVPLEPVLKIIGVILGVTLVAAVLLFISIITGVIAAFARVLVGAVQFGTGIVQLIGGAFQTLNSLVGGLLAILGDIIHGQWSKIGTDAQSMWTGMTKGLGTIWSGFGSMITGLITATAGAVLALIGGLVGNIIAWFSKLVPGIQGFPGQIVSLFKGIPGQMETIGQQIIAGLVNAILNGVGAVGGAMRSLANNMLGSLKSVLGIASPSKVMMEIGGNTATGFLQGITGTNVAGPAAAHLGGVVAATKAAVSGGLSSAARSASPLGAGGGREATPP